MGESKHCNTLSSISSSSSFPWAVAFLRSTDHRVSGARSGGSSLPVFAIFLNWHHESSASRGLRITHSPGIFRHVRFAEHCGMCLTPLSTSCVKSRHHDCRAGLCGILIVVFIPSPVPAALVDPNPFNPLPPPLREGEKVVVIACSSTPRWQKSKTGS